MSQLDEDEIRWVKKHVACLFSKVSMTFEYSGRCCDVCGRQKTSGPPSTPPPTETCNYPEQVLNVSRLEEAHQKWCKAPPPDDLDDLDDPDFVDMLDDAYGVYDVTPCPGKTCRWSKTSEIVDEVDSEYLGLWGELSTRLLQRDPADPVVQPPV